MNISQYNMISCYIKKLPYSILLKQEKDPVST